jgi:hypothetical protein
MGLTEEYKAAEGPDYINWGVAEPQDDGADTRTKVQPPAAPEPQ